MGDPGQLVLKIVWLKIKRVLNILLSHFLIPEPLTKALTIKWYLNSVLCRDEVTRETKRLIYKAIIESLSTNGSEVWALI